MVNTDQFIVRFAVVFRERHVAISGAANQRASERASETGSRVFGVSHASVGWEAAARVPQSASCTISYRYTVYQKEAVVGRTGTTERERERKTERKTEREREGERARERLAITAALPRSMVANLYDKQPVLGVHACNRIYTSSLSFSLSIYLSLSTWRS